MLNYNLSRPSSRRSTPHADYAHVNSDRSLTNRLPSFSAMVPRARQLKHHAPREELDTYRVTRRKSPRIVHVLRTDLDERASCWRPTAPWHDFDLDGAGR